MVARSWSSAEPSPDGGFLSDYHVAVGHLIRSSWRNKLLLLRPMLRQNLRRSCAPTAPRMPKNKVQERTFLAPLENHVDNMFLCLFGFTCAHCAAPVAPSLPTFGRFSCAASCAALAPYLRGKRFWKTRAASARLCEPVRPPVRPPARPSVRPLVRPSACPTVLPLWRCAYMHVERGRRELNLTPCPSRQSGSTMKQPFACLARPIAPFLRL